MKKFKRKLSGMTLVEILVALAVFASLALILAMMGSAVEKNTRAANKLNKRVAVNGPVAEAQNGYEAFLSDDNYEIRVANAAALQTNTQSGAWEGGYISIKGTKCFVDPANEELTNATVTNEAGDVSYVADPTATCGDYTFKYVKVPKPTGFVTPAATTTATTTSAD